MANCWQTTAAAPSNQGFIILVKIQRVLAADIFLFHKVLWTNKVTQLFKYENQHTLLHHTQDMKGDITA